MTHESQEPVVDETAPSQQSEQTVKPPRSPEFVAIITSTISLAVLMAALYGAIKLDFIKYQAMAAADRRAFQATIDEFRRDFHAQADAERRAFQARGDAERRAFQAQAHADRRAFQAAVEEFRREILCLSERQSRLEGIQEAQACTSTAGS